MTIILPNRGEVWKVELDPTIGHEQGWLRPCLVFSVNRFNHGPADLVVVLPITSRNKGIASHVKVLAGEAGFTTERYIKCEEIRCVSKNRFRERYGKVDPGTLDKVATNVRIILGM